MTDKRDAEKDLDFVGGITSGFTYPIFEYWIKEAEARRIRAEAAEQERDKLRIIVDEIQTEMQVAVADLREYLRFFYDTSGDVDDKVDELFGIVEDAIVKHFPEGSQPDEE